MPVWWGKKSSKLKEDNHADRLFNSPKKPKSFDEVLGRVSPRLSRDFAGGSSSATAFSGFESEGKCHPLPRPTTTTTITTTGAGIGDHGVSFGSGNGSGSVSSVSSTGSSEDQSAGQEHGGGVLRPQTTDAKLPMRSKSPGPGSRGPTSPTSPLNQLEDTRSQCHRLPLPPGSPTSPPTLPGPRACPSSENSKWKKGKLLGRGSFGHVYLGFNSEGGQMCAIKEVRLVSDDHTSRESLKQLHQEINLLSQLSHPNIVRYFGSELADDSLSVYLEFVSGGSIHKLLQEYGAFKEPVIQNYTRQILSGLAYLHGRKTVHRDIKGANILVDPNGEIKLADFGMAKHITNCSSMLSFKGSPYWMAPEVVMNTNGYSLAVDIWSLGCTVLEMATSKPPWSQYEGVAAIFKIGNSKDMPEIPDYLSNDAKSFVSLCLKRDPSARPTAAQLLDHRFIRDQTTPRTPNREPFQFDGSRTPPILEYVVTPPSRSIRNSRENTRTIAASMPVSPCSSPLRQFRGSAQQRSYLLSPPHPNFAPVGQQNSGYGNNIGPSRSCHTASSSSSSPYAIDPFFRESPLLKAHTAPPGGSPRTRLI